MMPEAAIAFACRSAIAVSCGSVLTVDRPCACRYREIISAMSSAYASVDVIATITPRKTAFIAPFPTFPANEAGHSLAPDKANIGRCPQGARGEMSAPAQVTARQSAWRAPVAIRKTCSEILQSCFEGLWLNQPK